VVPLAPHAGAAARLRRDAGVSLPATAAARLEEAARLQRSGALQEAAAAYRQLLARWPELPDCWYNLGLLERRLGRFEAALEAYAQALAHGASRPEEVHLNRGVILADCLRRDADAERELRAALALNPAYLPALQNLANLCEDLGRRAEALGLYERILALEPRAYEALARYAQIAPPAAQVIERLRAGLADPAASAADRASLGFALVRALDAGGAYAEAFAAAVAANRASRASAGAPVHYDRSAQERLIDALIAAFPGTPAAAAPRTPDAGNGAAPRLIFICGMFRSGSTLTERLLAGHPQVRAGGELDLLPQLVDSALAPFPAGTAALAAAAAAELAARYRRAIAQLYPGAQYVTDKRPDNFLRIGLIKRLFPQARIVHTTRDALDTCLSLFFLHLDQRLPYALDLMDIGHYFRQYRRLMAHWRSLYGEDILDFGYEQLVQDPRAATERLLSFCGLEWDEGCLDPARGTGSIKTASVWQVREAIHGKSCGRARHYARELAELAAYLEGA
jgi:tetratricopeptide (TPR) repeat protein